MMKKTKKKSKSKRNPSILALIFYVDILTTMNFFDA